MKPPRLMTFEEAERHYRALGWFDTANHCAERARQPELRGRGCDENPFRGLLNCRDDDGWPRDA